MNFPEITNDKLMAWLIALGAAALTWMIFSSEEKWAANIARLLMVVLLSLIVIDVLGIIEIDFNLFGQL